MAGVSKAGTKGVPRAEREQQILDVAVEEIGRVGYAGLSVGEVAEGAGVSKPLVYGYFQSKDGLYVACVQRASAVLNEAIEQVVTEPGRLDTAQRTLDVIFTTLEPRPHDWNVLFDRSHPAQGPPADAVRRARRRIADQAAHGVSTVLDTPEITDPADLSVMTDVWMGVVSSLVDWWLRHPDQSAQEMSARCRRIISAFRLPVGPGATVPGLRPTPRSRCGDDPGRSERPGTPPSAQLHAPGLDEKTERAFLHDNAAAAFGLEGE